MSEQSKADLPQILNAPYQAGLAHQIQEAIEKSLAGLGLELKSADFNLGVPADSAHGDYTTNAALVFFPKVKDKFESPFDLAQKLAEAVRGELADRAEKVEAVRPGFVNISVKNSLLITQVVELLNKKEAFGGSEFLAGKKILLEHTSPDPIKTIHIGHLRNNFLGMAFSRLFQLHGAEVVLDCINNDRGTHVARSMLGYLIFGRKSLNWPRQQLLEFKITDEEVVQAAQSVNWQTLLDAWLTAPNDWWRPDDLNVKSDFLNLIFYSLGDRAERLVGAIKPEVREILKEWEAEKGKVRALWRQIIDWSLSGYRTTYDRIGSHHDQVWFESDLYRGGKQLVEEGMARGIFKQGNEGAIVTDLKSYDLPDTVVIKADKTALYLTFDLNLTKKKREFFPADLYVWTIGSDQELYLRQLFAVCEQLGLGERVNYFHLNYGYVSLSSGEKMSSRAGTVVVADQLLDQLQERALKLMTEGRPAQEEVSEEEKNHRADQIGQAALKYALLRTGRRMSVKFDPVASVKFSGDCGPYLQYTFARARSVLSKAVETKAVYSFSVYDLFQGELRPFAGSGMNRMGFGGAPMANFSGGPMGAFGQARPAAPGAAPGGAGVRSPFAQSPMAGFKPPEPANQPSAPELKANLAEREILRLIARYPEVVLETTRQLETSYLCAYLYDLASAFNQLYNQHQILELPKEEPKKEGEEPTDELADADSIPGSDSAPGAEEPSEENNDLFGTETNPPAYGQFGSSPPAETGPKVKVNYLRLVLTASVLQVIGNGLTLLGIEPLEEM